MSSYKKKALENLKQTFGAQYDSDKDLTLEEQKKIKYSNDPKKTRKEIWENKGTWKKTKKYLKSALDGDKRRDK